MTVFHVHPKAWAHHFIMVGLTLLEVHRYDPVCGEHHPIWITITLYPVDLEVEMGDLG